MDIITIDGLAGSGKSSTAVAIARKLGYNYIDSGAIYRAVALLFHQEKKNEEQLLNALRSNPLQLMSNSTCFEVLCYGKDVTSKLRQEEIGVLSSYLATKPYVREYINNLIRNHVMVCKKDIVIEGRDAGTVIFPAAKKKFFFMASLEVRTKRRGRQSSIDDLKQIKAHMHRRDQQDQTRKKDPLIKAKDAILIDTSQLSFKQQVECVFNYIKK